MNSSRFLRVDGTIEPPAPAWWRNWLPSLSQVQRAIQLDFGDDFTGQKADQPWAISMRQGLGLVVIAALLAGFLPFIINTFDAVRFGTSLPLLKLADLTQSPAGVQPSHFDEAFERLTALAPSVFPRWFAALLSTIGEWINWPLNWLTWWLVYGTATLLATKVWATPTTLQRFLGVASYAAVPMILTGLEPIPCLGAIAQIAAIAWMLAVYIVGVRTITRLDLGRTILAILLPAAALSLFIVIVFFSAASSTLQFIF